jgi:hypothetical protein
VLTFQERKKDFHRAIRKTRPPKDARSPHHSNLHAGFFCRGVQKMRAAWKTSFLRSTTLPTFFAIVFFSLVVGLFPFAFGVLGGVSRFLVFGRSSSWQTMHNADYINLSQVSDMDREANQCGLNELSKAAETLQPPMNVCMHSPTGGECVPVSVSFESRSHSPTGGELVPVSVSIQSSPNPGRFGQGKPSPTVPSNRGHFGLRNAPTDSTPNKTPRTAVSVEYATSEGFRQAPHTPVSVGGTSRARHSSVHDLLLSSQPGGSIRSTAKNSTKSVIRVHAEMESQSESVSDDTAPPLKTARILATPSDVIPSVVSRSRALGTEFADMDVLVVTPAEPVAPRTTALADMEIVLVTPTEPAEPVAPRTTALADMEIVLVTPTEPGAPKTRKVRCCKVRFPPPIVNHILISFFML